MQLSTHRVESFVQLPEPEQQKVFQQDLQLLELWVKHELVIALELREALTTIVDSSTAQTALELLVQYQAVGIDKVTSENLSYKDQQTLLLGILSWYLSQEEKRVEAPTQ